LKAEGLTTNEPVLTYKLTPYINSLRAACYRNHRYSC